MKKISLLISAIFLLGVGMSQAQMSVVHNFSYESEPYGSLIKSGNVLYGMTYEGGANDDGYIFSVNTDGTNYKNIFNFADTSSKAFHANGEDPYGSLILLGNTLFGMTAYGGFNNRGTVFSIHTDGTNYRDLLDFEDTGSISHNWGGAYPYGSLVAIGGKLFGMTDEGGVNGAGNIFSLDTAYVIDSNRKGYRDLWDFNENHDSNGGYPEYGALAVSANGKVLYGMTSDGGMDDYGNVFSIDTNGKRYKDLYDFSCCSDGRYPESSVTLSGSKLFGMTEDGGGYNDGIIFSIDTNGHNYKQLVAFNYDSTGDEPQGDVTLVGNTLYGMTYEGNYFYDDGTLFSVDTNGNNFKDLFNFDYYTYGEEPYGDVLVSGGVVYGMTPYGGGLDGGTLFGYNICGNFKATSTSTIDGGSGNGTATANATGGPTPYTYLWTLSGQTTQTATGLVAGTYTVTVTNAAGCQTMSTVTVASATGISNIANNAGINVYPNPNNGSFTIALSGTSDKSVVEVFNMMGQQVYSSALVNGNNIINMNTKANGVYMYRIISDNGNLVGQGKLEVQK